MTAFSVTPERIIMAIEQFPDHVQQQFLFDRMDVYLGYGILPDKDTDTGFRIIYMNKPDEVAELLQYKLQCLRKCININQIFLFISKPNRLQLLQFLKNVYVWDKREYAQLLRDCWTSTEFPHQMSNAELIRMFKGADTQFLMTDDEVKALGVLPDIVTVYRGIQDKRTRHKALSWTTSYKVAHWFATRWNKASGVTPQILKSKIEKKYVFAYIHARNEDEIVLNPLHLKKMENVEILA